MKKYIMLFFALFTVGAFAQNLELGVTHYAWAAQGMNYGSDSVHYFGTVSMAGKDSINIQIESTDSVRYTVLLAAANGLTSSDTLNTKVTAQTFVAYHQLTSASIERVGWYNWIAGGGGKLTAVDGIKVYLRIWAVGTEVQKSNKRIKVKVKAFK